MTRDLRAWARHPARRSWAVPLLWCIAIAAVVYPFDGLIAAFFRKHRFGGDIRRELEAAQQYGQFVSSLLIALVIWLQDPARRRRLADWAAAFLIAGVACNAMKMLIGRPRPMFEDPHVFLGPLGEYPISKEVGVHHAWEFWGKNAADLWSMPSSHTAYACLMAVFIGSLYPRLRVLAGLLAALVGFARVVVGAHYPTDVFGGVAVGLCIGRTAAARQWGEILLRLLLRSKEVSTPADSGVTGVPASSPSLAGPTGPGTVTNPNAMAPLPTSSSEPAVVIAKALSSGHPAGQPPPAARG